MITQVIGIAQQRLTHSGLDSDGVSILAPSGNDFIEEVNRLVQNQNVSEIQRVLPYSAIIKNGSPRAIIAFLLRYDIENQSSQPIHHANKHVGRPGKVLVPPGGTFFASPIGNLTSAINHKAIGEVNLPILRKVLASRMPEYERQSRIAISLDAVVFEGGVLAGPDRSGFGAEIRGCWRAERELKQRIAAHKGSIAILLSPIAAAGVQKMVHGMTEPEHYAAHLAETARALLSISESSSEAKAREAASQLPRYPELKERNQ